MTACGRRTESATAPTTSSTELGSDDGCQVCGGGSATSGDVVEDDLAEVDRVDAVDHRLVNLGDDGDPPVGEPLDDDELPQRTGPVERPGLEPGDELGELGVRPRPGQRGAADVVADVEVLVVDPDRVREPGRDPADPLPVPGDERDAGGDVLDEAVEVKAAGRRLEDHDAADVHRRRRLLEVEERHVERRQPVRHRRSSSPRGRHRLPPGTTRAPPGDDTGSTNGTILPSRSGS